jgi:type IV secretion system protein VirB5
MRAIRYLTLMMMFLIVAPAANAQFAVIDVAAVTQLISEVQTLEQQLATARSQLTEAQSELQSMTGSRGMQQLLSGTVRNYLPGDWSTLQAVLPGGGTGGYGALAGDVARALDANTVLTPQQLAALPLPAGQSLTAARQSAALLQALTHEALANSSARFASLQQLINAIGAAGDQKSILELAARIGAESGMLQNERTKLADLYQAVAAEQSANAQRTRELVVAGHGQFTSRFEPRP